MGLRILHVDLGGAARRTARPRPGPRSGLSPKSFAGAYEGWLNPLVVAATVVVVVVVVVWGMLRVLLVLLLVVLQLVVLAQHRDGVVVVLQWGQRLQASGHHGRQLFSLDQSAYAKCQRCICKKESEIRYILNKILRCIFKVGYPTFQMQINV